MFFENGTVGLYDFSKNTILRFNLKGQLLSVQRCDIAEEDIKPFHIYPWNNGYIVLNSYGGESTDRKTLCFLNKELTSGNPIEGRTLSTGFSTYDDISIDQKGNVLYWEMLCDTLFTIHNGLLTPLFAIGASLGYVLGGVMGLNPVVTASLGYAAVFGSATNTLIAPMLIGLEVFGSQNMTMFVVVCIIAYVLNGNKSIYSAQEIFKGRLV